MKEKSYALSVIVPFYCGNKYMERLLKSIEKIQVFYEEYAGSNIEVIIVNDSPNIKVVIPNCTSIVPIVIENDKNMGIHGSRVNGLRYAKGKWVIFLDQDDELLVDGFNKQLALIDEADVIVGNGLYQYEGKFVQIYKDLKSMKYQIQKDNFLSIRNLIPSPGECMIRKTAIPNYWKEVRLKNNGSDDWLLWLLMFFEGKVFKCNSEIIYVHNDAAGNNLSLDLKKMYKSSLEMYSLLEKTRCLDKKQMKILRKAIDFKYYQDTRQLTINQMVNYIDVIFRNVKYKLYLHEPFYIKMLRKD